MITVDPYQIKTPRKLTNADGTLTREAENWFIYDNRWKENIWLRTGGPSDSVDTGLEEIEDNQQQLAKHESNEGRLEAKINTLAGELAIQSQENAQLRSEVGKLKSQLNGLIPAFVGDTTIDQIGKLRAQVKDNSNQIDNINQLIS